MAKKKLTIDKEVNDLAYNDKLHIYWSKTSKRKFTSVTTLIGKYHEKFDAKYWSEYKALEELLGDSFKELKRKYKQVDGKSLPMLKALRKLVDPKDLKDKIKEIKGRWAAKAKKACERGSCIHRDKELEILSSFSHVYRGKEFIVGIDHQLDLEDGIYPELLMYDAEHFISGQSDKVTKEGLYVDIHDYKSNEKLAKEAYLNPYTNKRKTMFEPISHLQDCTLVHYQLQLSLYAWILERKGLIPRNLTIEHIDHNGNVEIIELEYLRDEVEAIVNHHTLNSNYELIED